MLESFLWSCKPSACKFFKKRLQHNCFPVKFAKLFWATILKHICKRLLLEVFYKKALLKNFAIFTGRKLLVLNVLWKRCSWWLMQLWKWRENKIYQYVNIMWLLLAGKHLCWSLFLILSFAKFLSAPILKNICKPLLRKRCL